MKYKTVSFLFCIAAFTLTAKELPLPNALPMQEYLQSDITFSNSILAKISGKAISALDIKKRLDFVFNRQFPDLSSSPSARYEFYLVNWKHVLKETIDREMILADSKDKKLPVSDGDIRQELEDLFGPNVVETIDQLDMTYDEAWEMIHSDIAIRRMMIYRVHQKANNAISPEDVYKAYQDHIANFTSPSEWKYRVLTLRHEESQKASEYALEAHRLLKEENTPLSDLPAALDHLFGQDNPTFSARLSSPYDHTDKTLSASHRLVLSEIEPGAYSKPVAQTSRDGKSSIFRIFYLENYVEGEIMAFEDLEERIKNHLLDDFVAKETDSYLSSLRRRYGLDHDKLLTDSLSTSSTPFSLR